uniref:ATP synthase complex subunit 8 n=1 Tax=Necydalis ulmi TaxID=294797 RepID=U3L038_9CUCU|nr:ATP synthase F0 subunit 8 [Necydalis ulmi]
MPQMAPINWLTLFFYFITIFLITNSINYYYYFYTPNFILKKNKIPINWKL